MNRFFLTIKTECRKIKPEKNGNQKKKKNGIWEKIKQIL